jgi:hypothetical protein
MLNLLTDEYKKEILWEYRKRLIAITLFLISFAVVIGCVSLIPTYFNILQKRQTLEADKTLYQSKIALVGDKEIVEKVQTLTRDTDALQPLQTIQVSSVIDRVIAHAEEVKLNRFTFTLNADNTYTLDIQGNAPNRESLLSFSKTLKGDTTLQYDEKSLPLSSFTKTKDINFTLKVGVTASSTVNGVDQ